jgi:hypothetical protein
MDSSYVKQIMQEIKSKSDCEVEWANDGNYICLKYDEKSASTKRQYLIEFYDVDGAGTLGIKIKWILGKVTDFNEVLMCLGLNSQKYLDYGPLFTAIIPKDDKEVLFALVGQMIFPPGTAAAEVATLLFNNAYLNYAMFDLSAPGVELY